MHTYTRVNTHHSRVIFSFIVHLSPFVSTALIHSFICQEIEGHTIFFFFRNKIEVLEIKFVEKMEPILQEDSKGKFVF